MSKSLSPITLHPIGRVAGGRAEAVDDRWDSVDAEIQLDPAQFSAEATLGLAAFSHLEVIYRFDQVGEDEIVTGARHPRGRTDWPKVGIFAQRGRNRPNRLAVSICRIRAVDGLSIAVRGLDAIDGTPVLDIKPVLSGFLPRGAVMEPDWAREIMQDYW